LIDLFCAKILLSSNNKVISNNFLIFFSKAEDVNATILHNRCLLSIFALPKGILYL